VKPSDLKRAPPVGNPGAKKGKKNTMEVDEDELDEDDEEDDSPEAQNWIQEFEILKKAILKPPEPVKVTPLCAWN
jgi:hypothetical protein